MIEQLILIQKYDTFVNYIYGPIINASHRHKVLRDLLLKSVLEQYGLFHKAVKSRMKSRIYEADAGLANLRSLLRLACREHKILSIKQCETAGTLLSESGKILNSMIGKM